MCYLLSSYGVCGSSGRVCTRTFAQVDGWERMVGNRSTCWDDICYSETLSTASCGRVCTQAFAQMNTKVEGFCEGLNFVTFLIASLGND